MRDVAESIGTVAVLWGIAWIVVVGGIGAALGASRAGRPVLGLLVSAVIPVPIVGWLVVIGLTRPGAKRTVTGDIMANPFQALIDDLGPDPGESTTT